MEVALCRTSYRLLSKCDSFPLISEHVGIIVPDVRWAGRLIDEHNADQDFRVRSYSQIMDQSLAEQYREGLPWSIYPLS